MGLQIVETLDVVEREYKGVTFLIGSAKSKDFRQRVDLAIKRKSRTGDASKLSVDDTDLIQAEAAVGTVLVGWKNFKYKGDDIPFNHNNAVDLLTSDMHAREFIFSVANSLEEFELQANADLLKKSPPLTTTV